MGGLGGCEDALDGSLVASYEFGDGACVVALLVEFADVLVECCGFVVVGGEVGCSCCLLCWCVAASADGSVVCGSGGAAGGVVGVGAPAGDAADDAGDFVLGEWVGE